MCWYLDSRVYGALAVCSPLRLWRPLPPSVNAALPNSIHSFWCGHPYLMGLGRGPVFKLCQQNSCSVSYCRGLCFSWDSWVVLVVTQAGQLEGIQRGITSTSPPAPHLSAAVVVLPIDGWTWSGGVGLLIREGSVREPKGATAASPTVALAALSPPRMLLLLFESRMCAFLSE